MKRKQRKNGHLTLPFPPSPEGEGGRLEELEKFEVIDKFSFLFTPAPSPSGEGERG